MKKSYRKPTGGLKRLAATTKRKATVGAITAAHIAMFGEKPSKKRIKTGC